MNKGKGNSIFEYLVANEAWQHGYKVFHKYLGKPLGWFFYKDQAVFLRRLNRKECCNAFVEVSPSGHTCPRFIKNYASTINEKTPLIEPRFFQCYKNRLCAILPLEREKNMGALVWCSLNPKDKDHVQKVQCFEPFVHASMESYRTTCDLQNVYETVHPRAIALSSLHSVNRVISTTLKLDDLIPKIGRLCSQILKTTGCAILLMDDQRKWLVPRFVLTDGKIDETHKRYAMGSGVPGHVAETGDFHVSRSCIALPLIDDDVIGVIMVKNKLDKQPFSRSDVEILRALSEQAVVAIRNSQLLEEHERITMGSIKSINNILDINLPRERTYTHVFSHLVYELAAALGVGEEELLNIQRAAQLLDTGHLGIPEEIRTKKGKLSKREYDIIKTHPYRGVEIIKSIDSLKPVIPIILYHHERFDGKGYPEGLHGQEIPLGARIIALVVAFMAMITKRPYREARSPQEAIAEIKHNAGSQFDPRVVNVFLELLTPERIENIVKGIESHGSENRH